MKIKAIGPLRYFLIVWMSLSLVGCQSSHPVGLTITVQQVLNGQEFEVAGVANHPEITERIVLQGIQAPIQQPPWSDRAQQQLSDLIAGKSVVLVGDRRDAQGRRLAQVWHNGQWVNAAMLRQGHALWTPDDEPDSALLAYAQEQARLLGLGIWQPQQALRHLSAPESSSTSSGLHNSPRPN